MTHDNIPKYFNISSQLFILNFPHSNTYEQRAQLNFTLSEVTWLYFPKFWTVNPFFRLQGKVFIWVKRMTTNIIFVFLWPKRIQRGFLQLIRMLPGGKKLREVTKESTWKIKPNKCVWRWVTCPLCQQHCPLRHLHVLWYLPVTKEQETRRKKAWGECLPRSLVCVQGAHVTIVFHSTLALFWLENSIQL